MVSKSISLLLLQAIFCDGTLLDAPSAKSPQSLCRHRSNPSQTAKRTDNGCKLRSFQASAPTSLDQSVPIVLAVLTLASTYSLIKCPPIRQGVLPISLNLCTTSDHTMTPHTSLFTVFAQAWKMHRFLQYKVLLYGRPTAALGLQTPFQ